MTSLCIERVTSENPEQMMPLEKEQEEELYVWEEVEESVESIGRKRWWVRNKNRCRRRRGTEWGDHYLGKEHQHSHSSQHHLSSWLFEPITWAVRAMWLITLWENYTMTTQMSRTHTVPKPLQTVILSSDMNSSSQWNMYSYIHIHAFCKCFNPQRFTLQSEMESKWFF